MNPNQPTTAARARGHALALRAREIAAARGVPLDVAQLIACREMNEEPTPGVRSLSRAIADEQAAPRSRLATMTIRRP